MSNFWGAVHFSTSAREIEHIHARFTPPYKSALETTYIPARIAPQQESARDSSCFSARIALSDNSARDSSRFHARNILTAIFERGIAPKPRAKACSPRQNQQPAPEFTLKLFPSPLLKPHLHDLLGRTLLHLFHPVPAITCHQPHYHRRYTCHKSRHECIGLTAQI